MPLIDCIHCRGVPVVIKHYRHHKGERRKFQRTFRCPACNGTGKVWCDFFPADSEELRDADIRKAS